jgi:hypothetical protein
MSTAETSDAPHEIIIVKRGHGDHDEAHHGGVWKIAFADFMTAMMCFFLVMWLINAANEQTKAAVASYFNPVKLIDRNASRKGLEDLGDGPRESGLTADNPQQNADKSGQGGDGGAKSSQTQDSTAAPKRSDNSDAHLFADPYAVLSEIATDTGVMQNVSEKGDGGAQNAGLLPRSLRPRFLVAADGGARRRGQCRTGQDRRRPGAARRQGRRDRKSKGEGHNPRPGIRYRAAGTAGQGQGSAGRSSQGR